MARRLCAPDPAGTGPGGGGAGGAALVAVLFDAAHDLLTQLSGGTAGRPLGTVASMILIVAVLSALALGLQRGSLRNLGAIELRWSGVPLAAFVLQAILVNFPVLDSDASARFSPMVLALTYMAVLAFLVANRSLPGAPIVLAGACLNVLVMAANHGYMPVTAAALERSGHLDRRIPRQAGTLVYGSKDIVLPASEIRLGFLSDRLSWPRPMPLPATFSLGDVVIALGASSFVYRAVSAARESEVAGSSGAGGNVKGGRGGFQGRDDRRRIPCRRRGCTG